MNHIEPSRLKELRTSKGLTQKELGAKSDIDVQTIYRLERGKPKKRRQSTVDSLCKALNVSADVLAGEAPIPAKQQQETTELFLGQKSQLNHRITNSSRNAMALVAMRYRVPSSKIYEIAPFLFLWAAEQSLSRRQKRLENLESKWGEVGDLRNKFPHLEDFATYSLRAEDILEEERNSINSRDLFGLSLEEIPDAKKDYDEALENPFTVFLSDLAKQLGDLGKFEHWNGYGAPAYTLCPDAAAALVGGNQELAEEILSGNVAIHEIPKELRSSDAIEERVKWVRLQVEEKRKRFDEAHPGLRNFFDGTTDDSESSS